MSTFQPFVNKYSKSQPSDFTHKNVKHSNVVVSDKVKNSPDGVGRTVELLGSLPVSLHPTVIIGSGPRSICLL